MVNGIYIIGADEEKGEKQMRVCNNDYYFTSYVPDAVEMVAEGIEQNGHVLGHKDLDTDVYNAILDSARRILVSRFGGKDPARLYVGKDESGFKIGRNCYREELDPIIEKFPDRDDFGRRVREIVEQEDTLIFNTGVDVGDSLLDGDEYDALIPEREAAA